MLGFYSRFGVYRFHYICIFNSFLFFFRLNSTENDTQSASNLFVCDIKNVTNMQQMIEFSNQVSHWVSAEIVSCSSAKVSYLYGYIKGNLKQCWSTIQPISIRLRTTPYLNYEYKKVMMYAAVSLLRYLTLSSYFMDVNDHERLSNITLKHKLK